LLRGHGHRVSCVDLAGAAGSLVDPGTVRSFDEYTAPLVDLLAALPDGEKVRMQLTHIWCAKLQLNACIDAVLFFCLLQYSFMHQLFELLFFRTTKDLHFEVDVS
jgi:hypothetical protein